VARFDSLTGEYLRQPRSATPSIPGSVRAGWLLLAEQIWMEVSTKRGEWLARASSGQDSASVEWAVQSANLYRQAARFNVGLNSPERDSLMAANVAWLVTQAGAGSRIALWAHHVHISAGGDSEQSFNGGAQMGAYRRWLATGTDRQPADVGRGVQRDRELHGSPHHRSGGVQGRPTASRRAAFTAGPARWDSS
jgi:hypothetical protein